jgi:branched-chain amino acid transport system ATP-binding protein
LRVTGLVKRFGGFTALQGVDLEVLPGERLGLIGPNGSGKSTFVNCLTGALPIDAGSITFEGNDITGQAAWRRSRAGLSRSFQIPKPFRGLTVAENIEVPLSFSAGIRERAQIREATHDVLEQVGLQNRHAASPKDLSQVELRRLELARALAARPKLLIADEAMAGLSDAEVDEIIDVLLKLNQQGIAIILIEHIMRAVLRLSQRIVVLVAGNKIADGEPHSVLKNPEVERAYLG